MLRSLGPLASLLVDVPLPRDVFDAVDLAASFDQVQVIDYRQDSVADGLSTTFWLAVEGELAVGLAALGGVRLAIGTKVGDVTILVATVTTGAETSVTLHGLRLALRFDRSVLDGDGASADAEPVEIVVEGSFRIDSSLSFTASNVRVSGNAGGLLDLGDGVDVDGFHLDRKCLALTWTEPNLNRWLGQIAPDLKQEQPPADTRVTLRVILGQQSVEEIRFDCDAPTKRTFALPGLKITTPASRISVLVRFADAAHLALCMTFKEGAELSAASDFAWERDGERELHNDEERTSDKPLLQLDLITRREVSLVLLDLPIGQATLPVFLQQLGTALTKLNFDDPAGLRRPVVFDVGGLRDGDWYVKLQLNLDDAGRFVPPFLKQDKRDKDKALPTTQFLEIHTPTFPPEPVDFDDHLVRFSVGITVAVGSLRLDTACDFAFDWQTFALKVNHNSGVDLYATKPAFGPEEHLGLSWTLRGAPKTTGEPAKARYHYFTLVTKDHNYQVQQAPGATFEVAYTRASNDPIGFAISDFALGPKGLNLTADVIDQPVKLNGLDTRFRFTNSRLEIRENRINDFTLAGAGPLPPALVGDATADIALQFHQRDGALTLVAGGAILRATKPLRCPGTRFEFSVDALGLKFVDDGRFHLYFTITGSALFRLAPSDDVNGPLALLGNLKIDLVDCPLTGDANVIAKHVKFVMELPKPKSFNFLGCFEMELRAIGFIPQAAEFGGDGAMELSGQLKFAQGVGDTPDPRPDYHRLLIGLPAPGSFVPRIHFKHLAVNLNMGAAFRLHGAVEFVDDPNRAGLLGEGLLQIQGLPTFAASFGFLRIRRDENSPWKRAWFIYLEVRQISFMIPVVQLYIREVGLGFGYRYTIASIKAADEAGDVRELIKQLQALSRTQGDLSHVDRWAVDLEEEGQDPRWTIVLRAMISQTSSATSPLSYNPVAEADLACTFLFDAVIAFRSDLTFLMVVRGWLNTNYVDYVNNIDGIREKPLLSGFVLLSARQRRLLAHVANNPGVMPGMHPAMPDFIRKAIANSRFSATLLIEPGLFHHELGWPNMLRWSDTIGPLQAEFQGGLIFRISGTELVLGTSFLARASMSIDAGLDLGFIGARITATAKVAFGARYIGVLDFRDPGAQSALYAGIGLEAQITFSIELWLQVKLVITTIKLSFRFSLEIGFTASLEVGILGVNWPGIRGTGTVSLSAFGHSLQVAVTVKANEQAVDDAFKRTEPFLHVGLEATEVEPVPGTPHSGAPIRSLAVPGPDLVPRLTQPALLFDLPAAPPPDFQIPGYSIFVIRAGKCGGWTHFVLLPSGERPATSQSNESTSAVENGFLPPPPAAGVADTVDFVMRVPAASVAGYTVEQFLPRDGDWYRRDGATAWEWGVNWTASVVTDAAERTVAEQTGEVGEAVPRGELTLGRYLGLAFRHAPDSTPEQPVLAGDPEALPVHEQPVEDVRVRNPSDNSFEAAVRGAFEQFSGAPFFKHDPKRQLYDQLLTRAFDSHTTIYSQTGRSAAATSAAEVPADRANQQAHQLRGLIIHDIVADLRAYAAAGDDQARDDLRKGSLAFQMGLVFRVCGQATSLPAWLTAHTGDATPKISQRSHPTQVRPSDDRDVRDVRAFNVFRTSFAADAFPPQFQQVRQYTAASTIALSWDLSWDHTPGPGSSRAQADPEHHLAHYLVRRRALGGQERDKVYTVKTGQVLHREKVDGLDVLCRLRPRFQIVDHFGDETTGDLAALPAEGRSYLYTITPYDFAGDPGRPLTLVATRYPDHPPPVPADAELTVRYQVDSVPPDSDPAQLSLLEPAEVTVGWSEPPAAGGAPAVAVKEYWLIFRRERTLPVGSYGLDSSTQRHGGALLPTSNARSLPSDMKIPLSVTGEPGRRTATVTVDTLRGAGVLATGWRPEAWRVFIQTVSANRVPSPLAPVQLRLAVERKPSAPPSGSARPRREERRPAELEWLPGPVRLPLLPPEDQRGEVGAAHVPVPLPAGALRFTPGSGGDLSALLGYRAHPAQVRVVRLRWNQGPSGAEGYPLALTGGYHLLQLDVDAVTTQTLTTPADLAAALRVVQEIQMLPADDLPLTPGDTMAPSQWEAWYPGSVLRLRSSRVPGSQVARGPWYSWQESYLEWPQWPGLTDGDGRRDAELHPFLRRVVDLLGRRESVEAARKATGLPLAAYAVSLQTSPPMQPNDLAGFLASSPPPVDPYGWGVLQRFGLSVAFALHDLDSGGLLTGAALIQAVERVLTAIDRLDAPDPAGAPPRYDDLRRHLHVELLFQPGRSVRLGPEPAAADDLLGLIQVSLRPAVRQHLQYSEVTLRGPANASVDLLIQCNGPCSLVNQADPAAGLVEIEPSGGPVRRTVRLPLDGRADILLRARTLVAVKAQVVLPVRPQPGTLDPVIDALAGAVEYDSGNLRLTANRPLSGDERDRLRAAVPADDGAAIDALFAFRRAVTAFPVTDERSQYFTVPTPLLADRIAAGDADPVGAQWRRLARYLEALNSDDPKVPATTRISLPFSGPPLAATLPDLLGWLHRFFEASGTLLVDDPDGMAATGKGPWIASAYPRTGTPAYASPDPSGVLSYLHLIEDRWSHTYRYYIRPYGRYDLLWRSLTHSPVLFGDRAATDAEPGVDQDGPDPQAGGLDIVLDRTHPVDAPLVLASGRLDPPALPGQPTAPGQVWEVIVAEHPEQALSERNRTLARQLGFRGIACTVLRRFALAEWLDQVRNLVPGTVITIRLVEDVVPATPAALPASPDHLDPATLDADALRSLALPVRVGAFHQGVLALQWAGLPFYYEHRLLIVAQTDTTVSAPNQVIQRDFEYRSPVPRPRITAADRSWQPAPPYGADGGPIVVRSRLVDIPLCRLWDSLPETAQREWPSERPDLSGATDRDGNPVTARKLAALPDPDVVYEIVERFSGNVETQAEVRYDRQQGRYVSRQLGRRFLTQLVGIDPPAVAQGDFTVEVALHDVSEERLSQSYDTGGLPAATRRKLAFTGPGVLSFVGVMTAADRERLSSLVAAVAQDVATIESIYRRWDSQEPVTRIPDAVPAALRDAVDFPEATDCVLVWVGPMTSAEAEAVRGLGGDPPFVAALRDVAARAVAVPDEAVTLASAPRGLDQVPAAVQAHITVNRDASGARYTGLAWTGPLFDADLRVLRGWSQLPAVAAAVTALAATVESLEIRRELPAAEGRPTQADVPAGMTERLIIEPTAVTWQGRLLDPGEQAFLRGLGQQGDQAFQDGVAAILAALDRTVTVPLDLPVRPAQASGALGEKLLIARAVLRYHGLMSVAEAQALKQVLPGPPNQKAVQRLFDASARCGMRGRTLLVRARRGSAAPSEAVLPAPERP